MAGDVSFLYQVGDCFSARNMFLWPRKWQICDAELGRLKNNCVLRLGAQSFTLLNTLRDPTQLRRRQWATRQQHLFFGCQLLSSLEQLISAPNHE